MPTLLVATAGGHLQELYELLPRFTDIDRDDVTWVTSEGPQARSLLGGERVVLAPYARPRDLPVAARHLQLARRTLAERRYSDVISTGSSIAVPFLSDALLRGVPAHYVESATRLEAPSLAGRLLSFLPGVHLYRQATVPWRDARWRYRGSVYDGWRPLPPAPPHQLRRVAVATGSSESFGFRRLIEALLAVLPADVTVTWQTGSTAVDGLGIVARPAVPSEQLAAEFAAADVVVSHAGVGLSLLALAAGRCPVLVPRRRARGEHVDDHQVAVATMLAGRGLAIACEAGDLTLDVLRRAAGRAVERDGSPPPFRLSREPEHRPLLPGRRPRTAPPAPPRATRSGGPDGTRRTPARRRARRGPSAPARGAGA
jgi:UDP-N-acetylglucosamine--N-acetylmuramyl-(pentapeptide) pyrophosphoryl-undecaprenol N-acetylglucosamine transferase